MHFSIQKDVLVKALRDVTNAIATRVVQPILSNILIESVDNVTLRFTATDLDLTIRCCCPAVIYTTGSITIPGKKLLEVISKLANDLVSFQINPENKEVTITCQRSKFSIAGLNSEDFPKLVESAAGDAFLMPTDVLKRAITQTAFAAASYDASSILGGVYLLIHDGSFEATATDGSRLAHRYEELSVSIPQSIKSETDSELTKENKSNVVTLEKPLELKAIIPARACLELLKIIDSKDPGARVRIALVEGQIIFENETHFISTRLIGGEYPRYHELFPTEYNYLALFKREEMLSAVERVAVMSDDRTNLIKMHFEQDLLQISSNTPDVGRAQEEMSVKYEGQTLDIAVNVRYVLDLLQKLTSPEIRLEMTGNLKPLIFKGESEENYKYLLMPVQAR